MAVKYRLEVFGKQGCEKCGVLNQRLDKLLEKPGREAFEKHYQDIESETGMVAFAEAECLNPQRIPALLVTRWNEVTCAYEPVPNPAPDLTDPVLKGAALHMYVGLQTDYSAEGRGVITPKMIESCLDAVG